MKSKYLLQAVLAIGLSLFAALVGVAQSEQRESKNFPPGPCHQNVKACAANMQLQLNRVAAYVKRLKPGDKVSFNPQPDPPGDPNPWYRPAREAFGLLQEEV